MSARILDDEAVEDALARYRLAAEAFHPYAEVPKSLDDIPALCATVKQLRARQDALEQAATTEE